MDDLVAFLRAELDADEGLAQMAAHQSVLDWIATPGFDTTVLSRVRMGPDRALVTAGEEGFAVEHAARHDPARVLCEVAAKRAIVDWLTSPELTHCLGCEDDRPVDCGVSQSRWQTLRHLAAVYCDRPGYREDWRP